MYLGERLGVEVDRSTKCHPELAGEGIEYTWGLAKGLYRKARLSDKKGKENFRELVKRCLSTEVGAVKGSLTHLMIRKFINHCFTKIKNESEGMEAGHDKV